MSDIDKLAIALTKAQAEIPAVKMDAVNPFYKSKYATLGAIIETAKPILAKHGLSIVQFPISNIDGESVGVRTLLMHESGQSIEDTITIATTPGAQNPAQEAGKIVTYLRRYSYAAVLGMYADEAIDTVDKFLSDALVNNLHEVQIIHGTGGGVLAKLVTDYLKNHPKIQKFYRVPGNLGITVVEL